MMKFRIVTDQFGNRRLESYEDPDDRRRAQEQREELEAQLRRMREERARAAQREAQSHADYINEQFRRFFEQQDRLNGRTFFNAEGESTTRTRTRTSERPRPSAPPPDSAITSVYRRLCQKWDSMIVRNPKPVTALNEFWSLLTNLGSNTNLDKVTSAFRAIAKKWHPDRGGDTQAMQAINEFFVELKKLLPDESRAA